MKRVILESPYAGHVDFNTQYARKCIRDCLLRGESASASHLLFTQKGILDDGVKEERELGIKAGLAWVESSDYTVVYCDLGISRGMKQGIREASMIQRIEHRFLNG